MKKEETVPCPHCHEEIRKDAKACPHCGSDDTTGWSDGIYLDGIDLPEEDEYEEIRRNEFGGAGGSKPSNRLWIVVTGIVVLTFFLLGVLGALR